MDLTISSRRRVADILLDVLLDEGVEYIFGNPGSTELPLLDAIAGRPEIKYVLGLHETTVVGMADGYALRTGKPSFVNLHTAGGLGNAMGMLVSAQTSRTPMVVTAGQQDTRHLLSNPWLSGDLVGIAKPACKWAMEIRRPEDLEVALRRAFRIASQPPMGPVFLSLPMDLLDFEATPLDVSKHVDLSNRPAPDIGPVLDRLTSATNVAIVVGDGLSNEAGACLHRVAHAGGYAVYGSQLVSRAGYPSADPCWQGFLRPDLAFIRDRLTPYDCLIIVGEKPFLAYPYREIQPLGHNISVIQFAEHASGLDLDTRTDIAVVGDLKAALSSLAEALTGRLDAEEVASKIALLGAAATKRIAHARTTSAGDFRTPVSPQAAALTAIECLRPETVIVNEAAATFGPVHDAISVLPGRYFFCSGGVLGWGMPAAVGLALAQPGPVACLSGDGGTLYSPQALWSAAHHALPITFIVFNNARYNVLMNAGRDLGYRNAEAGHFVGMDLVNPLVDYQKLSQSLGVTSFQVREYRDIDGAIREAQGSDGPSLVEILIS